MERSCWRDRLSMMMAAICAAAISEPAKTATDTTINNLSHNEPKRSIIASLWKCRLLDEGVQVIEKGASGPDVAQDAAVSQLYVQIGRLEMELECLKKATPFSE